MKRNRYTEAQIAFCLRQHQAGTPVGEIVRKMGVFEKRDGVDGIVELLRRDWVISRGGDPAHPTDDGGPRGEPQQ